MAVTKFYYWKELKRYCDIISEYLSLAVLLDGDVSENTYIVYVTENVNGWLKKIIDICENMADTPEVGNYSLSQMKKDFEEMLSLKKVFQRQTIDIMPVFNKAEKLIQAIYDYLLSSKLEI